MRKRLNVGGVQKAERFSGDVKVSCRFDDTANQYVCAISLGGRLLGRQYVSLPGAWATLPEYRKGVDSPEAFDHAAAAAIRFALDEEERGEHDWGIAEALAPTWPDGVKVRRRR